MASWPKNITAFINVLSANFKIMAESAFAASLTFGAQGVSQQTCQQLTQQKTTISATQSAGLMKHCF